MELRSLLRPFTRSTQSVAPPVAPAASNLTTDSLLHNCGVEPALLASSLRSWLRSTLSGSRRVVFAGASPTLDAALVEAGAANRGQRCSLGEALTLSEHAFDEMIVVEEAPSPQAWPTIASLAARPKVRLIWEAMRQELLLGLLASKLPYLITPEQLLEILRSEPGTSATRLDRPIVTANDIVPFRGKRVIEFGPLDGAQTAAIMKYGASELTCIEIRPDNYLKSLLTSHLIGGTQVSMRMDNFHAVTPERYGTFDICVAHGVYYHSNAPFQFLANMAALAPVIVFGGFCATDDRPGWTWIDLESEGCVYRVKNYSEVNYFTAGVSVGSYFFEAASIQRWFTNHGFELLATEVRDVRAHGPAGEFVYFVARRVG